MNHELGTVVKEVVEACIKILSQNLRRAT